MIAKGGNCGHILEFTRSAYKGLEDSNPIGFGFAFINYGRTPARDFNFVGSIDLLPYPLPANFKLPRPPERPPQDGVIFPDEKNPMIGWVWERHPMSEPNKKELISKSPSKQIYMHGTATYRDVFNKRRRTNFCFFLNHTSIIRDNAGMIIRESDGKFRFQVAPCAGRNQLL